MKLFIDANILVDLLTERKPFYEEALSLFSLCSNNQVKLVTNTSCMSTASYYTDKLYNKDVFYMKMKALNNLCPLIVTNQLQMEKVILHRFADFEDSIHYECALEASCTHIITRDKKGFQEGKIPFMNAKEFIIKYKSEQRS